MTEGKRYLFTGGGTGGHVMPNLAISREILEQEPESVLLYVGSGRGPERKITEGAKIPFVAIPARPFASPRRPRAFLIFALSLLYASLRSLVLILRFRPQVVIATGGYVSVPAVLAAALLRRPIFLHEQNVKPGKANMLLARFASRIGVSFEETLGYFPKDRAVLTGYPVRRRIAAGDRMAARERLRIPRDQQVAFVLGGSMGSRSINRATVEGLNRLLEDERVTLIHSTGLTENAYYDAWKDTNDRLRAAEVPEDKKNRYILKRYFDQIEDAYAASDLVVTRAGAGVVMELAVLGKPALLIPKSDGADDHQLVNAVSLKERGSAEVLFEEMYEAAEGTITRVHGDQLARKVRDLLGDPERLERMARSARNLAVPDAGPANARLVRELASQRRRPGPTSTQVLVGSLEREDGSTEELFFPVTLVADSAAADVRVGSAARGARALIRRTGHNRETTVFTLFRRAGEIRVEDEPVDGPHRLIAGQHLRLGDQVLRFNARIETRELEPRHGRVVASVLVTGLGTLLSRLCGLVREVVLASTFGAGRVMDIVAASLGAANLFRGVFAENAVDATILPTYMMLKGGGRADEARRFLRSTLSWGLLLTCLASLALIATTPWWLPLIVPGFAAKGFLGDAIALTRLMQPYLVFVTLAAIVAAILKAHGRFAAPAYSSVMFSVGLIGGALAYPRFGLSAIGIGLLAGGLGQLVVQLPVLLSSTMRTRTGISLRPALGWREPGMRKLRAAAPKIVADVGITKISTLVDLAIVSRLAIGGVSALYYGMVLFQLPFALVAQSINTVALREYSERQAARDQDACRRIVTSGIAWNAFLLLPISAVMVVMAQPIVDFLLRHGVFSRGDARAVATAFACYALGLVGWGIQGLMGRFYAARLEIGQAVLINLGAVVVNVGTSLALVAAGFGIGGVALGTTIAFMANAAFRVGHLRRKLNADGLGFEWKDVLPSLWRALVGAAFAALAAYLCLQVVKGFDALPDLLSRLVVLGTPILAALPAYLGVCWALRSAELDEVMARFSRLMPRLPRRERVDPRHMNVHCLRPEQLLGLALNHPESVRDANLTGRVKQFLAKPNWKQRNIGVKLVGLLKIKSLRYQLVSIVTDRRPAPLAQRLFGGDFAEPGFVRRNALHSLRQLETLDEDVERALLMAMTDPYFEVRSTACQAIAFYAKELSPAGRRLALRRLKTMALERNFEVAKEAVRGLAAAALDAGVAEVLRQLHYHPNWRVRHAVVRAYHDLYRRGVIEDRDLLRSRLDDLLVTCDSFTPSFELKETLAGLRKALSGEADGRAMEDGA
ncbi:MAG: murein biosynthesis integral membrane protein MurJ [Planctomycetes bacterium]|nr:murein biosynthesis integral membrane protein MurJ [Planctomycetota bacterium]